MTPLKALRLGVRPFLAPLREILPDALACTPLPNATWSSERIPGDTLALHAT